MLFNFLNVQCPKSTQSLDSNQEINFWPILKGAKFQFCWIFLLSKVTKLWFSSISRGEICTFSIFRENWSFKICKNSWKDCLDLAHCICIVKYPKCILEKRYNLYKNRMTHVGYQKIYQSVVVSSRSVSFETKFCFLKTVTA